MLEDEDMVVVGLVDQSIVLAATHLAPEPGWTPSCNLRDFKSDIKSWRQLCHWSQPDNC